MRVDVERRSGHLATTSRRVWGEDPCAEPQALPFPVPYGSSQEKRPALKPCVLSTLGVARAVPMWGKPADGHAAAKPLTTALLAAIAPRLASPGVAPGASIESADAALVTADHLTALRAPWFRTRFPATSRACARVLEAASARNHWEEGGGLAQTPPTQPRPGTC